MSLECDMELDILKLQIGKIKQVFRLEPKTQCDQ